MENNIQEIKNTEVAVEEVVIKDANIIEEVATETKKYNFRQLKASDIGLMTKFVKKIGINKIKNCFKNDEIKNLMSGKSDNENLAMEVGIEIVTELIQIIVDVYDNCENELHELLSATSNLELEEVQNLGMEEFLDMLYDFFTKKEFMGFFKRVLKLLGMAD